MGYFKITKDIIYISNSKNNINIIHISDIHYSKIVSIKKLNTIIDKINNLKPDYIVITGDTIDSSISINSDKNIETIINFFKKLASISKTIISLGNHDFYKLVNNKIIFDYPKEFWDKVEKIPNVYLLNNKIYANSEIEFFGYCQPKDFYWSNIKEEKNEKVILDDLNDKEIFLKESKVPKIGLIHAPSCMKHQKIVEKLKNFDIILSGHMHNGCVFPGIDELWKSDKGFISASKKLFPSNCRGRIIKNNKDRITNIIISGGITIFSKCTPILLHPFNIIYPYHINQIIITNDKNLVKERTYKYEK